MKKFISVMLSVLMLAQMTAFTAMADSEEFNVGLHAAAFAYGSQTGTKPGDAVDGDARSCWISGNTNANYRDYLTLDLGGEYPISTLNINLAEGSAQNFIVYGAANAALGSRTAVTDKITDLTPGVLTPVTLTDSGSYRYLIFEQDAAEISFGFNEIEVYTTADTSEHITGGPAVEIAVNANKIWYVNYPGYAQGNGGTADLPKITDSDPQTAYAISTGHNPAQAMIMLDLGEAKTISHLVWQGAASDNVVGSSGYDSISKFQIVASNDDEAYKEGGDWTVICDVTKPDTYVTEDGQYDTGLMVFDLVSALGETPYRYYGIIKEEATAGTTMRLKANTLKVYERTGPPIPTINIAQGKAAFAYNSAAGTSPALALDGDPESYWESLNNASVIHDQFVIDLGASSLVDSIYVQLAHEGSAAEFDIYGSNNMKDVGRIKLAEVTDASADGSYVFEAGTASYRYIIFDKAPSAEPMGFAEIEIYAQALSAGEETSVSLISEGKTITGSSYSNLATWDIGADEAKPMTDNNPQTKFGRSAGLSTGERALAIFVDLGMEMPVSHVVFQGTDRDDDDPVSSGNEGLSYFKIVGTNNAPGADMKWTVIGTKTGYPYVGEKISSDIYSSSDPEVFDTGMWVFPADGTSYRYIGIVKTESGTSDKVARISVNTLQVYSKSSDVVEYVESTGKDMIVESEKADITADSVSYKLTMLNGSHSAPVTGLFEQKNNDGKQLDTAYAKGRIPPAGSFGSLELTASVENGEDGTWSLAMLEGRKVTEYISDLKKLTKATLSTGSGSGSASYKQSGLTAEITGNANTGVLGMLILNPDADPESFGPEDIYTHQILTSVNGSYTFRYTLPEDAPLGDYTVILVSDTGILTDKEYTLRMFSVDEIREDFADVTGEGFLEKVKAHEEFFGSSLVSDLEAVSERSGNKLSKAYDLAKEGMTQGLFDETLTDWKNVNTIAAAVKAAIVIEATLSGDGISKAVQDYGNAMPVVFENADINTSEFCDILPSVMKNVTADNAQKLSDAYERTIALCLIANGTLAEKEKAITDYPDALGINASTLDCNYTKRALADELSSDISTVKSSYADGMDSEIDDIIDDLDDDASEGGSSVTLGSGGTGGKSYGSIKAETPGYNITPIPQDAFGNSAGSASGFSDIGGYEWASDAITTLTGRNIIAGVGNGCFNPSGLLTREQAVKLLVLTLNIPTDEHRNGFRDCVYGSWYYPYITSAKMNNLVTGVSDADFGIGQLVTRQDLAVMIYRALSARKLITNGDAATFNDSDMIADYAVDAVEALGEMKLITGYDNGSFGPRDNATRAEAAVIFARLLEVIENSAKEATAE